MYHPNRRYGNPAALRGYTIGMPLEAVARMLHRHPRTVRDWMTEKRPMPYWVEELLELRHQVDAATLRQMGIKTTPRAAVMPLRGATIAASVAPALSDCHARRSTR